MLSIESQINELKALAARDGLEIVAVLQESRSAKGLGRPVFAEMHERITRGQANGILCWKLDRLARNFIDGGSVIDALQRGVIAHIRTFERNYYPEDNVLLMAIELGMANQYSRDLAVNVSRGLRTKAQMGWYPVQPPLGYLNTKTNQKGSNTILNDPGRFGMVRKLWDMMLTGAYTATDLWRTANNQWGLTTRRGITMSRSNIYALFTNPFYYGEFEWPRRSGNWFNGAHEPMITREEYDKVQILLGRKGCPRPKNHVFAFVGTMRCGECGMAITAEEKIKNQQNGNVHHYTYYHCTKTGVPCTQGSIRDSKLMVQITECLNSLNIPEEFHEWGMKWLERENAREVDIRETVRSAQKKAYDEAVRMLDRYGDMRAREEISEEEYREKKTHWLKEKGRCFALLNDTDGRVTRWANNMESAFDFVTHAKEEFENGTLEKRRRIFLALGSNLTLKDKTVSIDLEKTLLPMKKVAGAVQAIHASLEPQKDRRDTAEIERLYDESPLLSGLMHEARTVFIEAALTTLDFSPRYFSALEFRPKQLGRVRARSLPSEALLHG
ncbi:site-specific DNA recombinase [Bradyrhizobium sp. JR18.2]